MVAVAAGVVLVALAWIGIWRPMNADIARLTRDVPRLESLASLPSGASRLLRARIRCRRRSACSPSATFARRPAASTCRKAAFA